MKKDQLTCTKGTRKSAIRKTHIYPPIPDLPLIKNIQEALDYIFIQHKTKIYLEKEVEHWKSMFQISKSMENIMDSTLKIKDHTIDALKMGDIPPDTYVELINTIEAHKADKLKLEKEIKELKRALKKSKKFHYHDFILN